MRNHRRLSVAVIAFVALFTFYAQPLLSLCSSTGACLFDSRPIAAGHASPCHQSGHFHEHGCASVISTALSGANCSMGSALSTTASQPMPNYEPGFPAPAHGPWAFIDHSVRAAPSAGLPASPPHKIYLLLHAFIC